jgi:hypothetical protein
MQELIGIGNDLDAAQEVASSLGGVSYLGDPDESRELPFRALVRVMTDNLDAVAPAAGLGLYVAFCRTIRERPELVIPGRASTGVTAIFPMLHHPDLDHRRSDDHWRDTHAPLALRHHPGMWDYTQLSVVHTIQGPELDGFALCSFASLDDMKHKFFGDDHDREVIYADVASFANPRSPRRVVATETIHGQRPPVPATTWPHD